MKRTLLLFGMFASTLSFAQDCSELFISEYVEGVGNNKALEIYNPTANPIDLSQYFVARYNNGSTAITANNCVQLTGTVAAYSTHVGVLDKRDPNGQGTEIPIWTELEAIADAFYSPDYMTSNTWYWNGNDCIMLAKGSAADPNATSTVLVDFFGKVGPSGNPENTNLGTNGWSSVSPFNMTAAEGGNALDRVVTENHSMIRKSTVLIGKNNVAEIFGPSYIFDPLEQYDSIPAIIPKIDPVTGDTLYQSDGVTPQWDGNWSTLGSHTCACAPASTPEVSMDNIVLYPNPTVNGSFVVKGTSNAASIVVFNTLGGKVFESKVNSNMTVVDLGDMKGLYLVRVYSANGESTTKRVILK